MESKRVQQQYGFVFYHSVNGVWLVKEVPAAYLEKIKKEEGKARE